MKAKIIVLVLVTGFVAAGFTFKLTQEVWPVPDADKNKVNPISSDASSISDGKSLWVKHCESCHGKKGLGDGSKSSKLKTEPGNFSKATTQSQTDGSLYYKIAKGREDMPGFKKKIPENDDIWSLVNFMRTLKTK